MKYTTEITNKRQMAKLLPLKEIYLTPEEISYPTRITFDTNTKWADFGPGGEVVSLSEMKRIVRPGVREKLISLLWKLESKLPKGIQSLLAVNGIERLKKRAIKSGHCKPEGNAIDYPKSGVRVV